MITERTAASLASRYVVGKPGSRFAVTTGGAIPRLKTRPKGGVRILRRWVFWWSA